VWTTLAEVQPADIWLDVSMPDAVFDNVQFALQNGMDVIIGTTGLTQAQITTLQTLAQAQQKRVLIVPNFSLSAVLLMQFAEQAAQYFPDVEIIEVHNPKKLDAPSGTAKVTAQRIAQARQTTPETALDGASRGENIAGIPVHAMRLPGYIAQQTVAFGGLDEQLTLTQSTTSRTAFVPGVLAALRGLEKIDGLQIGLESVL
jgi:4-hydroxy-tetrahydrodipicolinate reductase